MRVDKRHRMSLKTVEPLPLPESLEQAFEAVENLDAMHPSSRGQAFGAIIHPPDRANLATLRQEQ